MYEVGTDELSQPEIDALPESALTFFAEARVVIELSPWSGEAINAAFRTRRSARSPSVPTAKA